MSHPYRLKKILSQRSCIASRVNNSADEVVDGRGGKSGSLGEDRNDPFQNSDGEVRSEEDKNVDETIDLPSTENKEIKSDKTCR